MDEVRRRLVDFLMGLGGARFVDAIDYLDDLRKAAQERGKREPELDVKWARCQIAVGKERSALEVLNELVGFNEKKKKFNLKKAVAPKEIEAYTLLAEVLQRRFAKPELADQVMAQLITANPDSSEAHYRYGRYAWRQLRSGRGDWEKEGAARAVEEFQRSLELKPGDPDVTLALADIAISRGTMTKGTDQEQAAKYFEEAKALVDKGLQDHPKNGEMYRDLG